MTMYTRNITDTEFLAFIGIVGCDQKKKKDIWVIIPDSVFIVTLPEKFLNHYI